MCNVQCVHSFYSILSVCQAVYSTCYVHTLLGLHLCFFVKFYVYLFLLSSRVFTCHNSRILSWIDLISFYDRNYFISFFSRQQSRSQVSRAVKCKRMILTERCPHTFLYISHTIPVLVHCVSVWKFVYLRVKRYSTPKLKKWNIIQIQVEGKQIILTEIYNFIYIIASRRKSFIR